MRLREYIEKQIDGILDVIISVLLKTEMIKLPKPIESTLIYNTYQKLTGSFLTIR
jgi:hypothetical protein